MVVRPSPTLATRGQDQSRPFSTLTWRLRPQVNSTMIRKTMTIPLMKIMMSWCTMDIKLTFPCIVSSLSLNSHQPQPTAMQGNLFIIIYSPSLIINLWIQQKEQKATTSLQWLAWRRGLLGHLWDHWPQDDLQRIQKQKSFHGGFGNANA